MTPIPEPVPSSAAEASLRALDPAARSSAPVPWRWVAVGIFFLSSSVNYLDRLLLAALGPTLMREFHLNNFQFGQIQSVFSVVYAVMAPLAGLFIDRVGLTAGIMLSMTVWSLAGCATGFTQSFRALLGCRTVLGIAEAAGIPCTGKANGTYLEPGELALGTACNQVGITIGSVAAPLLVAAIAPRYGWRATFVVCGLLGLLWVPLWWITSKRIPARAETRKSAPTAVGSILRDQRLWGLVIANALVMSVYTLWSNWTTVYFVHERHLTEIQANQGFAWIPPVFATFGGFFGGWLAFRWIRGGIGVLHARMCVCWIGAVILLATAAVPVMPTTALTAAAISLSFFWTLSLSVNMYAMPIDWFGPSRAAFGVSALTCSYGLMQAFLSPVIGATVDHFGFNAVCLGIAVLPLAGIAILQAATRGANQRTNPAEQPIIT